jgi:pyruvate/2-oxoglutarate/acetoin dehydrogenase E1 component
LRFSEAINKSLESLMDKDDNVYLIGEDIVDPYGGAFKITRGLSTKFPERVISSPISEGGIIGLGTGMSIEGFYPIVEIMFGDFMTLGFDQIINSAAKFRQMYNNKVEVPLAIRTPMGGGRGYGPTHSQSLESFFLGIPGFKVFNLNVFQDIEKTVEEIIINTKDPKLIVEHKLDYPEKMLSSTDLDQSGFIVDKTFVKNLECISISMIELEYCDCTMLAYGHTALLAKSIIKELMIDFEIACHLVIPTQLFPFEYDLLENSIANTGRLIILEEGHYSYGFGSEIAATIQERCFGSLKSPVIRVASEDNIIPASKEGESSVLINKDKILKAVHKIMSAK